MIGKKSQVTIWIILGVVILITVVGIIYIKNTVLKSEFEKGREKAVKIPPHIVPVKVFVEGCLEKTALEGILVIGSKGGYFYPPVFSTSGGIAYYYSNGNNYMPSKKQIEEELSFYINEMLFFCTRNFVNFPGLKISQKKIKTETKIQDNNIILNLEYPLSITKGDISFVIKDFKNIKIPVRLGIVYDSIERIIQEQLNHEGICLSCILDVSLENDFYVDMLDYDEETVIFIFRDENSKINNKAFEFVFANKYEIESE